VLSAEPEALSRCLGDDSNAATIARFIRAVRGALVQSLRQEACDGPALTDMPALIDYLRLAMAHRSDEEFRVLFLNARNVLLREETVATGIPNEVSVHPRMIVKRALELGATALILVHNHPSGSPDPSEGDLQTTARIVRAARTLDIIVHDHIIVASGGWRSFRQSGLMV
jgi:DNA repair protein RadC